jgi:hypothetical protein
VLALGYGCAPQPAARSTSEAGGSRSALVAVEEGRIRTVIHGNPFAMDAQRQDALVTQAMAAGVAGLSPVFTVLADAATAPEPHLVVLLNPALTPSAKVVCREPETVPVVPAGAQIQIQAAFCDGPEPLGSAISEGSVSGPTDRRYQQLLWRTAAALFPDDYLESYGFDILPRSFDFGIGGSTGLD